MAEITAFVLAGGQSSRMGRDKAFIELEGRTLLTHALDLLKQVTCDVHILGSKAQFEAHGVVVEDQFPNCGPLGGIHAALRSSLAPLNLILAVDMPFVRAEFLQYLAALARKSSAIATVPRAAGNWQPLCAIYRPAFADFAETALKRGRNKIDPLYREVEVQVVEEDELQSQGFSIDMFRNLNTPQEVEEATRR
jgi:molybdopterin-guanine dinucleotide biosynthesis protein A